MQLNCFDGLKTRNFSSAARHSMVLCDTKDTTKRNTRKIINITQFGSHRIYLFTFFLRWFFRTLVPPVKWNYCLLYSPVNAPRDLYRSLFFSLLHSLGWLKIRRLRRFVELRCFLCFCVYLVHISHRSTAFLFRSVWACVFLFLWRMAFLWLVHMAVCLFNWFFSLSGLSSPRFIRLELHRAWMRPKRLDDSQKL